MEPKHTAAGEDQWSQCVEGRYAGMISPSITDSRSCCHPLLIVLKVKETPRDGVRHTHTHTWRCDAFGSQQGVPKLVLFSLS